MSGFSSTEMGEIVREFIVETRENLDVFESTMLDAEKETNPSAMQLAAMFRSIHSIKGSCGFLGFSRLEALAHSGESLLGALRDRTVQLEARRCTALLAMVDDARRIVDSIEASGQEADVDTAATIAALDRAAIPSPSLGGADGERVEGGESRWDELGDIGSRAVVGGKIRVDVGLLDRLMNLVGELVLARNQVLKTAGVSSSVGAVAPIQRLNLVTTELQETVVKTRMQPIGNVWGRFPRIARELSVALGKKVRVVMDGRETELDKSVLEAIQDPLTHLVRNAIDHGIETPAERRAFGKPEEAVLSLRAFHEGGMVNIEIADDGAGIDVTRIRNRAVQLGLRTSEQVARLGDREALRLLFLPGFSTSERVTVVSGRGVGMDVVRANVEGIGGTVDIQSTAFAGTSIRIKIPLTLAIIPALIVLSGGARYAIPQASVVEVVRVEGEQATRTLEHVQGAPVLRLRGKLLPLAHLRQELGDAAQTAPGDAVTVVVLKADERAYGLVVDDIRDTEEIVVKPMWKRLKSLSEYAGATVMGDGRVALILDAIGLAQRVGVIADTRSAVSVQADPEASVGAGAAPEAMALLCRLGPTGRLLIPLAHVARLEEVPVERIESVAGRMVTQYRGEILSLGRVGSLLEERRSTPRDGAVGASEMSADAESVVVIDGQPPFGLIVDAILDIVSIPIGGASRATRDGVSGTLVVQGRITEILDVERVVAMARARGALRSMPPLAQEEGGGLHV